MALIQGEKLMIGPSTADGFRAAVSVLRSNDGVHVVSFHTFRSHRTAVCEFWSITWVGLCMRASSEWSYNPWTFVSRGSGSCDPVVATRTAPRNALPPTPIHCISSAKTWGVESKISHRTAASRCRWSRTWLQKAHCHCKRCQRFGDTQRNCEYAPRCVACGATISPVDALPCGTGSVLWQRGKPHSELLWLCEVDGSERGSFRAGAQA